MSISMSIITSMYVSVSISISVSISMPISMYELYLVSSRRLGIMSSALTLGHIYS